MCIRNGVEFLRESLESVLQQTYQDWELLIGVNGSDNADSLRAAGHCLKLADRGRFQGRVFLVDMLHCKNKPETFRNMLNYIDGEYVANLDVDDMWRPDKLTAQLPFLETYDVVGTLGQYFGSACGTIPTEPGAITFDMLLERNHVINSSVVMKPDCAKYPITEQLDDYPLWLQLAHDGRRIFNVSRPLTWIRHHSEQWFSRRDNSNEIRAEWKQRLAKAGRARGHRDG